MRHVTNEVKLDAGTMTQGYILYFGRKTTSAALKSKGTGSFCDTR